MIIELNWIELKRFKNRGQKHSWVAPWNYRSGPVITYEVNLLCTIDHNCIRSSRLLLGFYTSIEQLTWKYQVVYHQMCYHRFSIRECTIHCVVTNGDFLTKVGVFCCAGWWTGEGVKWRPTGAIFVGWNEEDVVWHEWLLSDDACQPKIQWGHTD